jgi:hypothetical protein
MVAMAAVEANPPQPSSPAVVVISFILNCHRSRASCHKTFGHAKGASHVFTFFAIEQVERLVVTFKGAAHLFLLNKALV